jgi:hypothetical protein
MQHTISYNYWTGSKSCSIRSRQCPGPLIMTPAARCSDSPAQPSLVRGARGQGKVVSWLASQESRQSNFNQIVGREMSSLCCLLTPPLTHGQGPTSSHRIVQGIYAMTNMSYTTPDHLLHNKCFSPCTSSKRRGTSPSCYLERESTRLKS